MRYFAYIDKDFKLVGWLTDDSHGKKIPEQYESIGELVENEITIKTIDPITKEVVDKTVKETSVVYNTVMVKEAYIDISDFPDTCFEVTEDIRDDALSINANYYNPISKKFELKDFRTTEEIEKERISLIKDKAGQIITSKYDIIKQMNILGEGGDKQIEMVAWIKKIRDISNKAEANGTALSDIKWD